MKLPLPRGPISTFLIDALMEPVHTLPAPPTLEGDPLAGDDRHLALYLCYELHYEKLEGVDEAWEWEPSLLAFRAQLESQFLAAVVSQVGPVPHMAPEEIPGGLRELTAPTTGPTLAAFVEKEATIEQAREFVIHRSAYHLKEADPHSWVIPRLRGDAKAALIEIQADEYGGGFADRMHATLFARTMSALDLDPTYGAYIDLLPGNTLATVNLMSFFGLHRRWRGAAMGHLAAFEMTSSLPNRSYANGFRRLGFDDEVTRFFDEHVEADSVHEAIAAHDLAGGLAKQEPDLAGDILFGAASLLALDDAWAGSVLSAWAAGRSSLAATSIAS